ncbi:hypothetical protein [Proteus terrae]
MDAKTTSAPLAWTTHRHNDIEKPQKKATQCEWRIKGKRVDVNNAINLY